MIMLFRNAVAFAVIMLAVPFQLATIIFGYIFVALDELATKIGG